MSICSPCTQLKQISLCTDSLIIGTVSEENTAYLVYFKSLATGALYKYSVTSDSNTILTLQFTDGFPLASGTGYEMWVNLSGDSIEDKLDLTVGATTATCYTLSAQTVYDVYYDVFTNYDSQTLEVL
jgi:hypothetical protein